jgi:hypothetical protein
MLNDHAVQGLPEPWPEADELALLPVGFFAFAGMPPRYFPAQQENRGQKVLERRQQ